MNATCNHTLDHRDAKGTWTQQKDGKAVRIVCEKCGKFYGRLMEAKK